MMAVYMVSPIDIERDTLLVIKASVTVLCGVILLLALLSYLQVRSFTDIHLLTN